MQNQGLKGRQQKYNNDFFPPPDMATNYMPMPNHPGNEYPGYGKYPQHAPPPPPLYPVGNVGVHQAPYYPPPPPSGYYAPEASNVLDILDSVLQPSSDKDKGQNDNPKGDKENSGNALDKNFIKVPLNPQYNDDNEGEILED